MGILFLTWWSRSLCINVSLCKQLSCYSTNATLHHNFRCVLGSWFKCNSYNKVTSVLVYFSSPSKEWAGKVSLGDIDKMFDDLGEFGFVFFNIYIYIYLYVKFG